MRRGSSARERVRGASIDCVPRSVRSFSSRSTLRVAAAMADADPRVSERGRCLRLRCGASVEGEISIGDGGVGVADTANTGGCGVKRGIDGREASATDARRAVFEMEAERSRPMAPDAAVTEAERNTSSGGTFSPSVRASLAIFRRLSRSFIPCAGDDEGAIVDVGDVGVVGMFMLNTADIGESVFCSDSVRSVVAVLSPDGRTRKSSGWADDGACVRPCWRPEDDNGISNTNAIGGSAPSGLRFLSSSLAGALRLSSALLRPP